MHQVNANQRVCSPNIPISYQYYNIQACLVGIILNQPKSNQPGPCNMVLHKMIRDQTIPVPRAIK